MVTIEEYKEMIASKLSQAVSTFDDFRNYWIDLSKGGNLSTLFQMMGLD